MNRYEVSIWVKETIDVHRVVYVEAKSFSEIQTMHPDEFAQAIIDFSTVLDREEHDPEVYFMDSLELLSEDEDNTIPPDEKPDFEQKSPNAGRDDR
tara:strand:- start:130 stop:417 length:288 start_codon:yes stop_codon:yes gene_type:complete